MKVRDKPFTYKTVMEFDPCWEPPADLWYSDTLSEKRLWYLEILIQTILMAADVHTYKDVPKLRYLIPDYDYAWLLRSIAGIYIPSSIPSTFFHTGMCRIIECPNQRNIFYAMDIPDRLPGPICSQVYCADYVESFLKDKKVL